MSDNTRFKFSFRVNHPTIPASEIVKTFAMPATKLFQSIGLELGRGLNDLLPTSKIEIWGHGGKGK